MKESDKLKLEIEKKKKELEKLIKKEADTIRYQTIKKLSDYTDEEKIKKFDYLYNFALEELNSAENKEETDEHYAWEAIMELLSKKNDKGYFWGYYNNLKK
jgi:hypothetical protein